MTNEQKLLCYLYSVPSIQRKQLVIALPDMPYQSITLAVRKAVKDGYIEVFRKDESNHVRLTPEGTKYIRATAKEALDSEKRTVMKRRMKGEMGVRLNRLETTACLCRAAGILPAKEIGISLQSILTPSTDEHKQFLADYFPDKGLLFLSDEVSNTIKADSLIGEEYFAGMSRLTGIVINSTGVYYLYCTLDKVMRWQTNYERRRVNAISSLLQNSKAAGSNENFASACRTIPKSIIIGKTCAMIPKIITGDKYGRAINDNQARALVASKLMTLENLEQVYKRNYFVPANTLGVEILSRTVTLTRADINRMIEMWLSQMTEKHVTVSSREYIEAYIDDNKNKTLVFPTIEFEELTYQKAGKEPYHIVCEKGTQEGISRAMGSKVIDFVDMSGEPLPVHKYDDDGIRRDGVNPLTHSGYLEEEQ